MGKIKKNLSLEKVGNKLIDIYIKLLINHSTQFNSTQLNSTQLNSIRQCEKWNLGRERRKKNQLIFNLCCKYNLQHLHTYLHRHLTHHKQYMNCYSVKIDMNT